MRVNKYTIPKSSSSELQKCLAADYVLAIFVVFVSSLIFAVTLGMELNHLREFTIFVGLTGISFIFLLIAVYRFHSKIRDLHKSSDLELDSGCLVLKFGTNEHRFELEKAKYVLKIMNSGEILLYGIFPGIFGQGLVASRVWDLKALDDAIEEHGLPENVRIFRLQNLYLKVNKNIITHVVLWGTFSALILFEFFRDWSPVLVITLNIGLLIVFAIPYHANLKGRTDLNEH